MKVIKLFAIETIQEARLRNAREREISIFFKVSYFGAGFGTIASGAAPFMTTLAFIALFFTDKFEIADAFTTMSLFQTLGMTITMLPMVMTMLSEASISSERILTFLRLPERDKGLLVYKPYEPAQQDFAIKFHNKPSFSWARAEDIRVPPILDPFFKEMQMKVAIMNK